MSFRLLSSEEGGEGEGENSNEVVSTVDLWLLSALLFFCAVVNLRLKVPMLPQTGLLMLAGVVLRCVGTYVWGFGSSARHMDGVNSDTIMLLFLPALIAECALSLDWYTFKREIVQILMLATSAVVLSSFLTAIVVRDILNYHEEFNWYEAFLIGAILSATDHVSVVAILKEMKADDKLQVLMQGETLVNDGTVLALFDWLLNAATKKSYTSSALVGLFFRLWGGGLALGVVFCIGLSIWLSKLVNHVILETLLTIVGTYLLFYTAELEKVHFSGGIAVVVFGLYMSAYGKTFISPMIEKSLHAVWTMLGTCIEALILILGGSLLGTTLMNKEDLHYHDIWMVFALFPLLHIVRAIVIIVHWPFLRLFGYGCTYKQALILIFGALKGTISIALGLIVYTNEGFTERQQDIVLFWSCATSALCICFDSMIVTYLIHKFGFEEMTRAQEMMLVSFSRELLEYTKRQIKEVKEDQDFARANWEEVKADCASTLMLSSIVSATKVGKAKPLTISLQAKSVDEIVESFHSSANLRDCEMEYETRRRFFAALKKLYWHRFEEGLCFRESAFTLIESANRSLDQITEPMKDWDILVPWLLPKRILGWLNYLASYRLIGRLSRYAHYWYITRAYDTAVNFIKTHREVEEELEEKDIVERKEVLEDVMKESHEAIKKAELFLKESIMDVYPEVYVFVQTHQVRHKLLYGELKQVEEAYKLGTITKIEYSELKKWIQKKIEKLEANTDPRPPDMVETVKSCYLFMDLANETVQDFVGSQGELVFRPTERRRITMEERKGLFLVLKGRVREVGRDEVEHCPGDVIGTQFLLAASPYYARDNIELESVGMASILLLPMRRIDLLMQQNEDFLRKMYTLCALNALKMTPQSFGELSKLPAEYHRLLFANSSLERLDINGVCSLRLCAVLLSGSLSNGLSALAYIDGRESGSARASSPCIVLRLSQNYQDYVSREDYDVVAAVKQMAKARPDVKMSLRLGVTASQAGVTASVAEPLLGSINEK